MSGKELVDSRFHEFEISQIGTLISHVKKKDEEVEISLLD